MRMSTKAQYAVRALVSLNLTSCGDPVSIKDISAREHISLNYLEQLFVKLRRGEIVRSVRGPGGGYVLARSAADIRVDEIIDTVEETLVPVSCMDADGSCKCNSECATQSVWQGLGNQIRSFLASMTLEDLTNEGRQRLERSESNQC
ncbi:transcriptional regulator, BadM/Rrf2 family [Malonomonas rubra DSM 5091]|uniref:Transcriptional regulator, BadM/Rrf2 family n=1 Tax=Malonomonas rubra DSM 5091 TaxID=1122189 RepID=A0A1M6B4L1_MALRU|nr:Rrf2 family transcriptional regulator [Malonomonas rubra]SHI43597.1 transcriptional regulator, BadM/Rrf2 family [Malonomonas rubra DSM 5091]